MVWEWGMEVMGITWGAQALRVLLEHILGWSVSPTIPLAALIALVVRFLLLQPVTLEGGWGDWWLMLMMIKVWRMTCKVFFMILWSFEAQASGRFSI
jgi:hypothetical protein